MLRRRIIITMVLFVMCISTSALASTIYVDADADGNDDGSSWTDAYNHLQDALGAASSSDEIWVAEGTYKPDTDDPDNREIYFNLVDGVDLYGGFNGTETSKNERDWATYETILSGDINEPNDADDNSYHVVVGSDNATLDGFTVTKGNADVTAYNDPNGKGGGIYCWGTSPTISNCIITENYADDAGGGMYNDNGSSSTVTNCTFSNNSTEVTCGLGAGMSNGCWGCRDESPRNAPTVTNCTFANNGGSDVGSGMCNYRSDTTVTNCTFVGNGPSIWGGGIGNGYICAPEYASNTTITNCTFINNYGCGGLANYDDCETTVTNCIFIGNKSGMAGGMLNWDMPTTKVTNCTFVGNLGLLGGAMYNYAIDSVTITNSILWGNIATYLGNEIYNDGGSDPNISYCDIKDCGGSGGGWDPNLGIDDGGNIDADPCFVNIFDFSDKTIAAGTTTTIKVTDAGLYEVDDVIEYENDGVARTVTDVNITTDIITFANDALSSNSALHRSVYNWGIGATDVTEDVHLIFTYDANQYSVCMDTANPNSPSDANDYDPYDGNSTDIDGQLRAMDGDGDGNSVVDMGVDEVPGPCLTCVGDLDGDRLVKLSDMFQLRGNLNYARFLTGQYLILHDDPVTGFLWKSCSDMDQDYHIDMDDFNDIRDNLYTAYSLYGVYEYDCGDPNIP